MYLIRLKVWKLMADPTDKDTNISRVSNGIEGFLEYKIRRKRAR